MKDQEMAKQLADAGRRGHVDVYGLSLRSGGEWVHADAGSFLRLVEVDGEIYNDEKPSRDSSVDRLEAVGFFMGLVWLVDGIAGLGLDDRCREWFAGYLEATLAFTDQFRQSIDTTDGWGRVADDMRQHVGETKLSG